MNIDWAVIGSVAGVAAVIVALVQLRSSKLTKSLHTAVPFLAHIEPSKIKFSVAEGSADLDQFDFLKVHVLDERRSQFDDLKLFLGGIHFGVVTLRNESKTAANRVHGEIRMRDVKHCQVETTAKLAKSAVVLGVTKNGFRIEIAEMPPGEIIEISCVGTGSLGWNIEPLNAAVVFERKTDA